MPRIHRTGAAPTGTGGPPTGAAGGDLEGSEYPNPLIAAGKVTEGKLAAEAVSEGKIKASAVSKGKLAAGVQEELEPKVTEHSFAIAGTVAAEEFPGFYVKLGVHESKNLIGAEFRLISGTSIKAEVLKAGVGISEYTGLEAVSTEAKRVTNTKALSDKDLITLKTATATGTPKGLTFTLFIESVK